jgi:hypothetical protein
MRSYNRTIVKFEEPKLLKALFFKAFHKCKPADCKPNKIKPFQNLISLVLKWFIEN